MLKKGDRVRLIQYIPHTKRQGWQIGDTATVGVDEHVSRSDNMRWVGVTRDRDGYSNPYHLKGFELIVRKKKKTSLAEIKDINLMELL